MRHCTRRINQITFDLIFLAMNFCLVMENKNKKIALKFKNIYRYVHTELFILRKKTPG